MALTQASKWQAHSYFSAPDSGWDRLATLSAPQRLLCGFSTMVV